MRYQVWLVSKSTTTSHSRFWQLNWCRRGPQLIQATSLGLKLHGSIDPAFLRHQLSRFIQRVLAVPLISNHLASIHKLPSRLNSINSLFCGWAEMLFGWNFVGALLIHPRRSVVKIRAAGWLRTPAGSKPCSRGSFCCLGDFDQSLLISSCLII